MTATRVGPIDGSLTPAPLSRQRRYWLLISPFVLVFLGSALLNFLDPVGGRRDYLALGFPEWSVWWASAAKVLGLLAIIWGRSRTLSTFAYAGFLFDLLLAITAHVDHEQWLRLAFAVVTLALTALAYRADAVHSWRRLAGG